MEVSDHQQLLHELCIRGGSEGFDKVRMNPPFSAETVWVPPLQESSCVGSSLSDIHVGDADSLSPMVPALVSPTEQSLDVSLTLPSEGSPSTSAGYNIDTTCNDIGLVLRSIPQIAIRNLPPKLILNHFRPESNFKFPSRFLAGCNRACQHSYLVDNTWFVYSKAEDGIFCLPCVLFAVGTDLGQFVNEKFDY